MSSWLRIMAFRIFGSESSEMKHMIHMMTMMGMMDGMTRMTPECPIICSSNHIDDASGLLRPMPRVYVDRKPFRKFRRVKF